MKRNTNTPKHNMMTLYLRNMLSYIVMAQLWFKFHVCVPSIRFYFAIKYLSLFSRFKLKSLRLKPYLPDGKFVHNPFPLHHIVNGVINFLCILWKRSITTSNIPFIPALDMVWKDLDISGIIHVGRITERLYLETLTKVSI